MPPTSHHAAAAARQPWPARAWARLRRRRWRALATGALTLLALLQVLGIWSVPLVRELEAELYDMRLRFSMPHTLDERVVIIDVDERSLARLGQWPWDRSRIARLVDELIGRQQVAALGLDLVFAEPDGRSPLAQLQGLTRGELRGDPALADWLARNRTQLDHDATLARTLARGPTVLGYYFTSDRDGGRSGRLPPALEGVATPPPELLYWDGFATSIAPLAASSGAGFINAVTDEDGQLRSVPLVAAFEGALYESLRSPRCARAWVIRRCACRRSRVAWPAAPGPCSSAAPLACACRSMPAAPRWCPTVARAARTVARSATSRRSTSSKAGCRPPACAAATRCWASARLA